VWLVELSFVSQSRDAMRSGATTSLVGRSPPPTARRRGCRSPDPGDRARRRRPGRGPPRRSRPGPAGLSAGRSTTRLPAIATAGAGRSSVRRLGLTRGARRLQPWALRMPERSARAVAARRYGRAPRLDNRIRGRHRRLATQRPGARRSDVDRRTGRPACGPGAEQRPTARPGRVVRGRVVRGRVVRGRVVRGRVVPRRAGLPPPGLPQLGPRPPGPLPPGRRPLAPRPLAPRPLPRPAGRRRSLSGRRRWWPSARRRSQRRARREPPWRGQQPSRSSRRRRPLQRAEPRPPRPARPALRRSGRSPRPLLPSGCSTSTSRLTPRPPALRRRPDRPRSGWSAEGPSNDRVVSAGQPPPTPPTAPRHRGRQPATSQPASRRSGGSGASPAGLDGAPPLRRGDSPAPATPRARPRRGAHGSGRRRPGGRPPRQRPRGRMSAVDRPRARVGRDAVAARLSAAARVAAHPGQCLGLGDVRSAHPPRP
jgi:hypothetical protein